MRIILCLAALLFPVTATAQDQTGQTLTGYIELGQRAFQRQCTSCHIITDNDGNQLAGRRGRTGPNLFEISARPIASVSGFRYSSSILSLAEADPERVWSEADFIGYVQDPTGWLRDQLGDRRARAKMAYRVRDAQKAADIYAYIFSLNSAE